MFCPSCGHENQGTSDFCGDCGASLAEAKTALEREAERVSAINAPAATVLPPLPDASPASAPAPILVQPPPPRATAPPASTAVPPPPPPRAAVAPTPPTTPAPSPSPSGYRRSPAAAHSNRGRGGKRPWVWIAVASIAALIVVIALLPPMAGGPAPTGARTGGGFAQPAPYQTDPSYAVPAARPTLSPGQPGQYGGQTGQATERSAGGDGNRTAPPSPEMMAKVYLVDLLNTDRSNGVNSTASPSAFRERLDNRLSFSLDTEQYPSSLASNDSLYQAAAQCGVTANQFRQGLQAMMADRGYFDRVRLALYRQAVGQ